MLPIAFLLLILCLLLLLVLLLVVLLLLLHAPHAELCFRPPLAVSKRSESQPTFPIRDGNGNGFLIGAFSLNKLNKDMFRDVKEKIKYPYYRSLK